MFYSEDVKPDSHLGLAIGGIIMFFPTGIPALIRAVKVSRTWDDGNKKLAWELSKGAEKLGHLSITLGIIFIVVFFVLYIGFLIWAVNDLNNNFYS